MPEYSSVKIVVTNGDSETTYEIPIAKNFKVDSRHEESPIRMKDRQFDTMEIESLSFTMHPLKDLAGKYMVITQRQEGKRVL